jgi:hypothetical protein
MLGYYRIVHSAPPTLVDFISNAASGLRLRPPDTAERRRLWEGLSVYSSIQAAEASAIRAGWRNGRHLAEIVVEYPDAVIVEKTLRDPAHYTMWGAPEMILGLVRRSIPIAAAFG